MGDPGRAGAGAPGRPSPLRELGLALYVPSLLVATGQQAVLIMLPLFALELGGGPAAAATFLGLRGLGTLLADLPAGTAVSRLGDKRTMVAGLAIMAAAVLGLAFADSVWQASALTLVFGAGAGTWMLTRMHYVALHTPASHRGRAMTVLAGLNRLGMLVGPALGGLTVKLFGYPAFFVAAGLVTVTGLALIALFTRHTEPERLETHQPIATLVRIVAEHRDIFLRAGSATLALQFVRAGRQLLVPLWGEAIGLDAAAIGIVFSLSSAIDAVMFYPAGHIMDFKGRKWAATPSLLILGASLGLLGLTDGLWTYGAAVLLSGLGNGFGTGVVMTMGADLSPARHRGEFLGVWRLIGDCGTAVGPLFIGLAAQSFALAGALGLCVGIGGLGAVVLMLAVPETLRRGARFR